MRPSDPLLAGLVDDAALFPPGNAPMPVALAEHARYRAAPWAAAIGPFLCPASRIDELVALLPADQHIRLALVVDVTGAAAPHARRSAEADPRIGAGRGSRPRTTGSGRGIRLRPAPAGTPAVAGYLEVAAHRLRRRASTWSADTRLAGRQVPHRRRHTRGVPERA